MKKNKFEYFKMKQKKIEAGRKESERKIDFTECPTRDGVVPRPPSGFMSDGSFMSLSTMAHLMKRRNNV